MKNLAYVGLGLAVGLGVVSLAAQSPPPAPSQNQTSIKTVADADAAIYAMSVRIDALEQRLDKMEFDGGKVAALPSAGGAPVMKVESITSILPDDAVKAQIRELELAADQAEQLAAGLDAATSPIAEARGVDDDSRIAASRQRTLQKQQAGDARKTARQKRAEAKQLALPRQVILGWSGKKSVELRTEKDLSAMMKDIRPGAFITAKGMLLDADDDSATAIITSISVVAAPANFTERPK